MTTRHRFSKHSRLDDATIKPAEEALQTRAKAQSNESESDLAIAERKKNRLVSAANERFVATGIHIKDIYGTEGD